MIQTNDFCSAVARSDKGFGYMWAGARATLGATRGKVSTAGGDQRLYQCGYTSSHKITEVKHVGALLVNSIADMSCCWEAMGEAYSFTNLPVEEGQGEVIILSAHDVQFVHLLALMGG